VAVYARDISARLGLSPDEQQLAHLSGLLHDIGKIGVRPGILEKNGPLTLQERREMEQHSTIGERILAKVEAYAEIATIVRFHHERVDGQGYPDGRTHDDIPIISRIICVADAYNAMTSDRPYRDAMPVNVARSRLLQAAGTQFDADVVATRSWRRRARHTRLVPAPISLLKPKPTQNSVAGLRLALPDV
jgi:HD-GYP domain-containing protein (c-di-GMP phosphodiesterase class II)